MSQVIMTERERQLCRDFLTVIEGLLPVAELVLDELGQLRKSPAICEHLEKAHMSIAVAKAFTAKYQDGGNAID